MRGKSTFTSKIKGKTILITGGTGSFGNTVLNRLVTLKPKKIIIFSRDEKKQFDMRNHHDEGVVKFVIGDVRDKDSVEKVMKTNIDYVFHAAALKQVPSCEFFPLEAIKTNTLGAHNVITTAVHHGVRRVVVLSTDKAVYPINAMGMTKALMEKVMIADAKALEESKNKRTTLCGVRYGNVLYSRGSVIPHYTNFIKQNKKLPITHPEMTRFLLPLSHAVDLVQFALSNGENGYMYVRKSPASTIETLAQAVSKIFSFKKGYEHVGIRAGEKMHETLISREEMIRAIDSGDYYKIPPESQGLDYNKYFTIGKRLNINKIEAFTSENAKRLSINQAVDLLLTLPEVQMELKHYKKQQKTSNGKSVYSLLDTLSLSN